MSWAVSRWKVMLFLVSIFTSGAKGAPHHSISAVHSNSSLNAHITVDEKQLMYTNASSIFSMALPNFIHENKNVTFLESPQCTRDLLSYYNKTAVPTNPYNQYTWIVASGEIFTTTIKPTRYDRRSFTITGPTSTIYTDSNAAATGGPEQGCCGVCTIVNYYVDISYWPQPNARTDCPSLKPLPRTRPPFSRKASNNRNAYVPHNAGPLFTPRAITPYSNQTGPVTAVGEDGFVYTSPSVYVVYESVWATNKCGYVGGMYTSLTWSFLPEQLSTLDKWGYTVPFDFEDLPCRTENTLFNDGYYHEATLAAVPQLTKVDSAFQDCFVGYWDGLDPPFAFQPQTQFIPTTTGTLVQTNTPAQRQSIVPLPATATTPPAQQPPSAPTEIATAGAAFPTAHVMANSPVINTLVALQTVMPFLMDGTSAPANESLGAQQRLGASNPAAATVSIADKFSSSGLVSGSKEGKTHLPGNISEGSPGTTTPQTGKKATQVSTAGSESIGHRTSIAVTQFSSILAASTTIILAPANTGTEMETLATTSVPSAASRAISVLWFKCLEAMVLGIMAF